jgi:NADPH:quinone reductase-like Zn-dependent oxidoreductase
MSTSPAGPHDTSRPNLMTAVTQARYGTPEVLELRQIPVPEPGTDEVLVRVRAASLNMYDWHMTTGLPRMARVSAGLRRPKHAVPGADVSGVVEATGVGVTRFAVGDEVMGEIGHGAFAEYAAAPQGRLVHKPAGVTFEQAAAVPMAGLTALQGLRDRGRLVAGQRVLVNGASGGVGTFAVMIARALGAQVTAVCSTTKVEMVRELGAHRVIDYTVADYTELVRDQHVLFDNVGDRGWRTTSRVLAPGGVNVTVTGPKHGWFGPMRELVVRKVASLRSGKRFTNVVAAARTEDLDTLAQLVASGQVLPVIERTWPLAGTPDALAHIGEGHARGKHVILP